MSKLSSKRQVTLPVDQCRALGIEPGDEVEFFVANGQMTLIKKIKGRAKGIVKHLRGNKRYSDAQSRQDGIG